MTGHASTSRVRSYRVPDRLLPWRAELLDEREIQRGYGIGFTRRGAIRNAHQNRRRIECLAHKTDIREEEASP